VPSLTLWVEAHADLLRPVVGPARAKQVAVRGTISYVTVVIVIAAIVIVAGVVFVAIGRGGELSVERGDYAPLELGPVSATDVVLLRPPTALWGYSVQATDEALDRIAASIRERDVRIVALEQLVTDLSKEPAAPPGGDPYFGARHRRDEPVPEAGGGWQTGTQPATAWQTGTAPAAAWQAPPEQPPEESHD
jgi:hypothetical protein